MLALCLMLLGIYYAENYAGIIGLGLTVSMLFHAHCNNYDDALIYPSIYKFIRTSLTKVIFVLQLLLNTEFVKFIFA